MDLLVDLDDGVDLLDLVDAEQEARRIIGATVDLVPFKDLKPRVCEAAVKDAIPL